MAEYFIKGIRLEQNKEPALSRDLKLFCGERNRLETLEGSPHALEDLTGEQIVELAKKARIVDESDGRPLHEKLREAKGREVSRVVVDAIDDEPYISSQLNPTLKLTKEVLSGLELVKKAVGVQECSIAIFKDILDGGLKIPKDFEGVPVESVQGTYPAEYRSRALAQTPENVVVGSCALIHLHRSVYENRVQTTCFVTVAGDCIANPANLEVSIGMPLQQILERCGLWEDPRRVVVGGSMTGFSVTDTEGTLVTPLTRGILAFKEDFKQMNFTCIGCGRCAQVCPEGLSPYYIYKFVTSKRYKLLENFDINLCTGCGTCSYVCPAKLDLVNIIAMGKREYTALRSKKQVEMAAAGEP